MVWSPDGQWIAFVSTRKGNSDIYVVNIEYGWQLPVTDDPADDIAPCWSPDGTQIVFLSQRGSG